MARSRKQIVIHSDQPAIHENLLVEDAAFFNPDGTPFSAGNDLISELFEGLEILEHQVLNLNDLVEKTKTFVFLGQWDAETTYLVADVVRGPDGILYFSVTSGNANNVVTDNSNWVSGFYLAHPVILFGEARPDTFSVDDEVVGIAAEPSSLMIVEIDGVGSVWLKRSNDPLDWKAILVDGDTPTFKSVLVETSGTGFIAQNNDSLTVESFRIKGLLGKSDDAGICHLDYQFQFYWPSESPGAGSGNIAVNSGNALALLEDLPGSGWYVVGETFSFWTGSINGSSKIGILNLDGGMLLDLAGSPITDALVTGDIISISGSAMISNA